ncbi:MAG: penicillin-binding protein 2 [Lachnospiraceae bacterium]|nr:penicillin-binding protein 2 [Lachnospiraceae bacterium]
MKKKRNRQILAVTWLFVGLFFAMMGYTCHYAVTHRQTLMNNSYNTRQEILIAQNSRGSIYAAGGQKLAETVTDGEGKETRVYPYANMFSHAVGYASNGKFGIEAFANYYLINSNTRLSDKVANDVAGKKYPGDSVITTLDVDLQKIAYDSLGMYSGAVIVSEPSTGRILAMVSKPDFDPNEIDQIWDTLINDKESSVLLNRTTQGLYPPGSTFKIVTALEYIRENPDSYSQFSFQCNGRFTHGEERINCYHGTSHGSENFTKAFAKSCNSAFASIGLELDRKKFGKTLDELLFNQELKVDFAYNQSKLAMDENTTDSDVMQAAIGQGTTQITPLELNMITAAIANDGELMKPYLLDRVETADRSVVKQFSPDSYKRLMSEEEAQIMTELMEEVVKSGTGTKLSGLSYTAAGKTGSAEYNKVKSDSHAWFTGFAPVEEPQVCVTIIIEGAGSGGDYAVPIAKRILDACFEE